MGLLRSTLAGIAIVVALLCLTACAPAPRFVPAGSRATDQATTAPASATQITASPTALPPTVQPAGTAAATRASLTPTATLQATVQPTATLPKAATPIATGVATPAQAPAPPLLLGYYVPYDASSWHSFQEHAGQVDVVAPQWVSLDACGGLSSQDDLTLVQFARARGVKVLPTLFTISGWANHALLTTPNSVSKAQQQIVNYVVEEGYDGIDLDLEGVDANDRQAFTDFVAALGAQLHSKGKLLFLAVPAKTYDATTGWAGAYDYAALSKHLDRLTIMAYAYSTSESPPGSTAPYAWVEKVTAFAVSQVPASKVLLGVAGYGYDWNTTVGGRARALRYAQAEAIASAYGAAISLDPVARSATFAYTAQAADPLVDGPAVPPVEHDIRRRTAAPCSLVPATPTSGPVPTALPRPTPVPVQQHVVWLENAASLVAKLEIAQRHGVGGISIWRLGQEDPAVWGIRSPYFLATR